MPTQAQIQAGKGYYTGYQAPASSTASGATPGSTTSAATPAASTPTYGQYGPNAAQTAAQGNTSPMGLGLSSIQSSAPPYSPPVNPQNASAIQGQMYGNATNPSLTPNETYTYQPIQDQPQDELGYNAIGTPNLAQAQTGTAATDTTGITNNGSQYDTYNPTMANAAVGTVDPNSLVQNQLQSVLGTDVQGNGVPVWAQTAVTAANQQMAALGLGSSTIAGNATASAILNTALPMAEQNATTFANVNTQNIQDLQQTLLSNQAATNAAAQFNSQNETQNNQFMQNLATNIAQYNASQVNAMTQFNAQQTNAMDQFNENMQNQVDEFNAQNQLLVDQSNVQWQRAINTANTAEQNATNQANVQNTFNLSQTALNNEWQEIQDQASWALSAGENSQNRGLTLASSALNQQTALSILNSQMSAAMFSQLGNFAVSALGGAGNIGKTLGLNGNSSSGNYAAGAKYASTGSGSYSAGAAYTS